MRYLLLVLLLLCGVADAKPTPKEQPPPSERTKKPPAVPDLATMLGDSNWGTVSQQGRDVFLSGHPTWEATGRIRTDGTLLLAWTLLATGEVCPGVYNLKDGDLSGLWGRDGEVTIEADGSLTGATRQDRIYKLAPPP